MEKILTVAGLLITLLATIFLYLSSKHLPWNMQSIGGKTDKERQFFEKRQAYAKIGFTLLFFGFLLQLISAVMQDK